MKIVCSRENLSSMDKTLKFSKDKALVDVKVLKKEKEAAVKEANQLRLEKKHLVEVLKCRICCNNPLIFIDIFTLIIPCDSIDCYITFFPTGRAAIAVSNCLLHC